MDGYELTYEYPRTSLWRPVVTLVTAVTLVLAGVAAVVLVPATRPAAFLSMLRGAGLPVALPGVVPFDVARPFDRTSFRDWADGIDGLSIPAPAPVGDFSAAEVATAIGQARQLVAALNLDREVIEGRRFDRYLGLLAEWDREVAQGAVTARSENFPPYLTVVADGFRLLPATPKARGPMTVRPGARGEFNLHVELRVAYAFEPGDGLVVVEGDLITVHHTVLDLVFRKSPPFKPATSGLSFAGVGSALSPDGCRYARRNLLAPPFADRSRPPCTR